MSPGDRAGFKRLDGWKAIAAYFNRDRTTVIRWARDRELPVHRIPGGKQGTVFAFQHELAGWALRQSDLSPAKPVPPEIISDRALDIEAQPARSQTIPSRRLWDALVSLALMLAVALTWYLVTRESEGSPRSGIAFPVEPNVARDYVAARDHWARRTAQDLATAVRLYQSVIRRDPGFAPAHAGLAEAWLITREYGKIDEPTAYRAARAHAERAIALDPKLPGAHRALGFIDYWWSGQPARALGRFKRALALDDRDPLTRFWYANILADLGRDTEAQREYDTARLLAPGSRVIEVEQACSHWQAGRDSEARQKLTALAERMPDDATIYNCLAWVYISHGDIHGYARALAKKARLRQEPQLLRVSRLLDEAIRQDPRTAVQVLVDEGRREIATGARQLRETPAFFASAMGDRASLVKLLLEANDLREEWPSRPVTRRIAERWVGDEEVQRRLRGLLPREANSSGN
jgi:Flp pilus assembly protein TadD